MSEQSASEPTDSKPDRKQRSPMSLSDRVKIIDYLRTQLVPVVADSKQGIAAKIAEATGVAVNWDQMRHLIGDLPEFKLDEKIAVTEKPSDPVIVEMLDRLAKLESEFESHRATLHAHDERIATAQESITIMSNSGCVEAMERIKELEEATLPSSDSGTPLFNNEVSS